MQHASKVFDPSVDYTLKKPITFNGETFKAGRVFPWKDLDCSEKQCMRIYRAGYLVRLDPPKIGDEKEFDLKKATKAGLVKKANELGINAGGSKNELRKRIAESMA